MGLSENELSPNHHVPMIETISGRPHSNGYNLIYNPLNYGYLQQTLVDLIKSPT